MHEALILWLTLAQTSWVPIPVQYEKEPESSYVKRTGETRIQIEARRTRWATAVANVAMDDAEAPLFGGPRGREMTALFLDSIASFEGGYGRRVDLGLLRGDKTEEHPEGRSWCQMQINIGGGKTPEGWTGKDLIADPEKCVRAGLHQLRQSSKDCRAAPYLFEWTKEGPDLFSEYTTGRCVRKNPEIRHRWLRAEAWMTLHPAPNRVPHTDIP